MRVDFGPTQVVGYIDKITATGTGASQHATFTGWALDPYDYSGTPMSASVFQYPQGSDNIFGQADFTTSIPRPDVAKVYPGRNPNSGFTVQFTGDSIFYQFVSGKPVTVALVVFLLPPRPNVIYESPHAVIFP